MRHFDELIFFFCFLGGESTFSFFRSYVANIQLDRWTLGWIGLVGSIKLSVSYAEYRLFHRALLQKRPLILSILLAKATPYESFFDETRLIHGYIYLFMCVSVCVCVCV